MNKRGQIYILVALILALVLYMLMTKTNIIYEHEIIDDFETLSRNYDIEASKFMNSLLSEDKSEGEVEILFDIFTCDFTRYAKNQNPDFSLIYVFEYGENLYIGNYLEQPILVEDTYMIPGCKEGTVISGGVEGLEFGGSLSMCGCVEPIEPLSSLDLTIGSTLYEIDITSGRPEIIIVSREDKGEQRKVYTKEEYVDGGEDATSGSDFCSNKENSDKYSSFCEDVCRSYKNLKEPCIHDPYCCWDKTREECVDGTGGICK